MQDIAGGEVTNVLEQSNQQASNDQDTGGETTEGENEQTAGDETIEMIAAQCVSVVHMRLKQNPTLLKAIHLGNEQLISRKHVMISYSWNAEKDTVVKIADAIAATGIEVWRDEEQLKPGTNLQRAMLEAVEGAVLVLVFYSPNYHRSQNCQFEYSQADELKRPIFPIVVDMIDEDEEKDYKTYDEWLKKELKDKDAELIYFKTSEADNEEKLNQLVEGVSKKYAEEKTKMESNFEELMPEKWNRTQVDSWLEKKNLHDVYVSIREKKLNFDGKALQALAKKAISSGDDEADDKALEELSNELVAKKVDSRLFLRFVSALRQL